MAVLSRTPPKKKGAGGGSIGTLFIICPVFPVSFARTATHLSDVSSFSFAQGELFLDFFPPCGICLIVALLF